MAKWKKSHILIVCVVLIILAVSAAFIIQRDDKNTPVANTSATEQAVKDAEEEVAKGIDTANPQKVLMLASSYLDEAKYDKAISLLNKLKNDNLDNDAVIGKYGYLTYASYLKGSESDFRKYATEYKDYAAKTGEEALVYDSAQFSEDYIKAKFSQGSETVEGDRR